MIEIDLSPGDRKQNIAMVGGINFSLVNVKLLIPIMIFLFAIEPIVEIFYEDDIKVIQGTVVIKNKDVRKFRTELSSFDDIKSQVKELNIQQKTLKAKIEVVKEIVEKRQNPYSILKYIADNTPSDVWIENLEIKDKNLVIKGYSKTWKSIGEFIENLKDSIFFSGTVDYKKANELEKNTKNKQIETFEIKTIIVSFK